MATPGWVSLEGRSHDSVTRRRVRRNGHVGAVRQETQMYRKY
jgi:hypothetical protein